MRHQPVKGTIIVWMRTQKEGITIWTWLVLRTTLPDLKDPTMMFLLRTLTLGTPTVKVVPVPMNQKPKLLTSAAHRSSATATTPWNLEAKGHSLLNPPKEPTRPVGGITSEGVSLLSVTATTLLCRPCYTAATREPTVVRMCTTYHLKSCPQATTSILYNTATANALGPKPERLCPHPKPHSPLSHTPHSHSLQCPRYNQIWSENKCLVHLAAQDLWFL